ncbi:MAG: hypothetical protein WBH24_15170 [Candidatus Acidiferrum sp.]
MTIGTKARVLKDQLFGRSLREHYWAADHFKSRLALLRRPPNHAFRHTVRSDFSRFWFGSVRPIAGDTEKRAQAAVDWILRAQEAGGDGGVSLGYFPCDVETGWRPSYPETTGYIITSLLAFSRRFQDESVSNQALRMANWESEIQMATGAVQGGPVCPADKQTPCAFNTGMVLDGWVSAYQFKKNDRILGSARRAADWLVSDLNEEGYFRTNGQFVAPGLIKTYNVLCSWAISRLGELIPSSNYQSAAIRSVEAVLRQQQPNGWYANNCLTRPEAPLLHTISYTLQGVLEIGISAGRADFVDSTRRAVDALLLQISEEGFIPGRFFSDWGPACFSSCLTGSAQLAVVCYRLFEHRGDRRYWNAAEKLVNYLKPLQLLNSDNPALNGALPGSFPLFGSYMTAGYPNWATKYLLDALLLQDRLKAA